jgi:hypothetical protein
MPVVLMTNHFSLSDFESGRCCAVVTAASQRFTFFKIRIARQLREQTSMS